MSAGRIARHRTSSSGTSIGTRYRRTVARSAAISTKGCARWRTRRIGTRRAGAAGTATCAGSAVNGAAMEPNFAATQQLLVTAVVGAVAKTKVGSVAKAAVERATARDSTGRLTVVP